MSCINYKGFLYFPNPKVIIFNNFQIVKNPTTKICESCDSSCGVGQCSVPNSATNCLYNIFLNLYFHQNS